MNYIILAFIIGILCDRYILVILDTLLELFTIYITRIYTIIQIDINTMSNEYQKSIDADQELNPAIGFHYSENQDVEYYDDCDDKKKNKVGFIK